jgi:phenylacetate-CoA ligase
MSKRVYHIPEEETLERAALVHLQRRKLGAMLARLRADNAFYRRKFEGIAFDAARDDLGILPLTTRAELEQDQADHPPFGSDLTCPVTDYVRLCQTSGSSGGRPMRWLDTPQGWDWCKRCWSIVYTAAGVTRSDRLFFPFSFGPFLGFWSGFDAAGLLGALAIPGGGMSTTARLRLILDLGVTVVCCTPTYAQRMAEVAEHEKLDIASSAVRLMIVAGEPGGSVPEIRSRIESAWSARVFDHSGMTEIGPLGFECPDHPGSVHLIESECIAEAIDPQTLRPMPDGEVGELVITNLGRTGSPVVRYRTGDQVRFTRDRCSCGRSFALARGGILGRTDDMICVRGINVFPSALEAIIGRIRHVAEFRIEAYDLGSLTQLAVDIEPVPVAANDPGLAFRVEQVIQDTLSLRAEVRLVPPGTLPRFEMKARRFIRRKVADSADAIAGQV